MARAPVLASCTIYLLATFYAFVAMLRALFTILRGPVAALRKTPRDGKEKQQIEIY